jgi:hypothetical protein
MSPQDKDKERVMAQPKPDLVQQNISEMEAKMAVICWTYHHTSDPVEFTAKLKETTSFPAGEIELAWELMDYMEWDATNSVPAGRPVNAH